MLSVPYRPSRVHSVTWCEAHRSSLTAVHPLVRSAQVHSIQGTAPAETATQSRPIGCEHWVLIRLLHSPCLAAHSLLAQHQRQANACRWCCARRLWKSLAELCLQHTDTAVPSQLTTGRPNQHLGGMDTTERDSKCPGSWCGGGCPVAMLSSMLSSASAMRRDHTPARKASNLAADQPEHGINNMCH